MKKNRTKIVALSAALIGVLAIGGALAYFTDGDTATNTFTVGKISLDLQEPNWVPPEDITPNQEIEKDPQVENDGINSEYVFVEVAVPYENVVTANADGTKNPAADTELFTYTVNEGWTEMGTGTKDEGAGTITHRYVYGTAEACTALEAGATTPTLFDTVTFANVVEDQGLEESTQNIVIHAYGIQTSDINGGKTAPADVWTVLHNQLPTTDVAENEEENTDIKDSNK